jgi:4-amino-4-deoxy-L-arabinose transferase-like glycosyltransferase
MTLTPRAAVALVGLLAAVVRVPLLFDRYDTRFAPDSALYVSLGDALFNGPRYPSDYRAPGYPAFIALAELLPGSAKDMTIALQHAIGVAVAIAVLLVGSRYFGRLAGVIAGVVAATTPVFLNVEHDILPDLAFTAATMAAAVVLVEAVVRRPLSYRLLAGAGVLFGVAAYIKPNGQAFVIVALVPLAFATRSLRQTLLGSAVLAAALLLTIAPWIVRNGVAQGHYALTTQGGDALWLRAFDQDGLPVPTETPEGRVAAGVHARVVSQTPSGVPASYSEVAHALEARGMSFAEAVRVEGRLARTAIVRHPATYVAGTVRNVALLWGLSSFSPRPIPRLEEKLTADEFPRPMTRALWGAGAAVHALWALASVFGLAGVVLLFSGPRASRIAAVTFASIWVIVTVGVALFNSPAQRFAAQVLPLYLMLGAGGAVVVATAVASRRAARQPS